MVKTADIAAHYPFLLVYDGECGLCTRSVQFVLRHDKIQKYRFCRIQSNLGRAIFEQLNLSATDPATLVALVSGSLYSKSEAVLMVGYSIGGWFRLLWIFRLLPRRCRDGLYDFVAKYRGKIFPGSRRCLYDPAFIGRKVEIGRAHV